MINKNRYYCRSRISEAKFRQLVRCFALDFTATSTAKLIGISVRSVNSIYLKIRQRRVGACEIASPLKGAVEVDESYVGARRVRGKRGRGAYGKTIVFGLLKRQGKVYTEIVHDCSKATFIHSNGWRGYDGLVASGFDKHVRVNHGENEFANGERHIIVLGNPFKNHKGGIRRRPNILIPFMASLFNKHFIHFNRHI